MDGKRLLLAAVLSFTVLLAWEWLGPKAPRRPPAPAAVPTEEKRPAPAPAPPVSAPESIAASTETLTTLENDVLRATFSNRGALMSSLVLRHHVDDQGKPLELVPPLPAPAPRALSLLFASNDALTLSARNALYVVEQPAERAVRFRYAAPGLAITKEVRLTAGYLFDVRVTVGGPPYTLLAAAGLRNPTQKERSTAYAMPTTAIVAASGGFERVRGDDAKKPVSWPMEEKGFAGLEDNYFLAVLLPRSPATATALPVAVPDASGKPASGTVAAGVSGSGELLARAYYGPKDVEVLDALGLGLERTVDFGWFEILARPLLWLLKWTYSWTGNYGVAILVVTLLIRILLFPLMHKSYASMKKMQKLAPKMAAIRDRYKNARGDAAQRAKMNQEMMALYQTEGYNPMSGCFPMLLQLPILIAFYNVLSRSIELRHAPFVFWIKDLSAVDRSYVLVIVMIATMYVQQAMTPSSLDPIQKRIFMAMPVIWGFFLKDMPSGLVLYWLFSNVLTILQQLLINKMGSKDEPKAQRPAPLKKARAARTV